MIRLKDVAESAGVSITTASCILNVPGGEKRFSQDCVQRVRRAAEELGYQGNYHSRSLRTGRSEVIGLAFSAPEALRARLGWFRGEMIAGMIWACADFGYEMMIINDHDHDSAVRRGMDHIRQKRIDALVVGCPVTEAPLEGLDDSDLPVALCRYYYPTRLPCVQGNLAAGPELVMDHLLDLGHRQVAAVVPLNCDSAPVATGRYEDVCRWRPAAPVEGLDYSVHRQGIWPVGWKIASFMADAEAFATELLQARPGLTAVVCWNELTAQGVYNAAMRLGLRIPDDLSVVTIYDHYARHFHPPLTALSFRELEMCHRAAELLLNCLMEGGDFQQLKGACELVEPSLVVRQSTGPARV